MPYLYSRVATDALADELKCITDRRANPPRGRTTMFQLAQQNMLAYTFDEFVPGFSPSVVVNDKHFAELVHQPVVNAETEGTYRFGVDFDLSREQTAKVEGDIFEILDAAVIWNTCVLWNHFMADGSWPARARFRRPRTTERGIQRQVAALKLPRNYDWVRLLTPAARATIDGVRATLAAHGLLLPTSTPDIAIVVLPAEFQEGHLGSRFRSQLPNLSRQSQQVLERSYHELEGRIEAGEFVLAVAAKKSLRSDRLYQPLYEANVMQLFLEQKLGAPQVDFEVHTLGISGTAAAETYTSAPLWAVATNQPAPHRAVRDLYIVTTATALIDRILDFLDHRIAVVP